MELKEKKKAIGLPWTHLPRESLILKCLPLWTWPKYYKGPWVAGWVGTGFGSSHSAGRGPVVWGRGCRVLSVWTSGKGRIPKGQHALGGGTGSLHPGPPATPQPHHFSLGSRPLPTASGLEGGKEERTFSCCTGMASASSTGVWTRGSHDFLLASEKSGHLNKLYWFSSPWHRCL